MGLDISDLVFKPALGAPLWSIAVKKSQRFSPIFDVLTVYKLSWYMALAKEGSGL